MDATTGLDNLRAVMEPRGTWRGKMDIELVDFPQVGVAACPGTANILDAAIAEGAQVVGNEAMFLVLKALNGRCRGRGHRTAGKQEFWAPDHQ
nr:hypothetical protein [uncultured Halomonas sp.]